MAQKASRTIAILTSTTPAAIESFLFPHNGQYLVDIPKRSRTVEREITPTTSLDDQTLRITFDDRPFHPMKGFTFGSDHAEDAVDILISSSAMGISRIHLALQYDWNACGFTVVSHSRHHTEVTTPTGVKLLQKEDHHALSSGDVIRAGFVGMRITYVDGDRNVPRSLQRWAELKSEWRKALPCAGDLSIEDLSQNNTFIPTESVDLCGKLGSGVFAKVHKAFDISGRLFAVKEFRSGDARALRKHEVDALRTLHHRNIIKIYEAITVPRLDDKSKTYLVMDLALHGDLSQWSKVLNVRQIVSVFWQLLQAVRYSHARGILHADIKPGNVLVRELDPMMVVLADFGLATYGPFTQLSGTPAYVAPEIVRHDKPHYTMAADIWSLGIMLRHISTGELLIPPFLRGSTFLKPAAQSSLQWAAYFESLSNVSSKLGWADVAGITKRLLDPDTERRPSADVCIRLIVDYLKCQIRGWVHRDRRRRDPASVCVSAVLEFGGMEYSVRHQLLRDLAYKEDAFDVSFAPSKCATRPAGLYVGAETMKHLAEEHLPDLAQALEEVVAEL